MSILLSAATAAIVGGAVSNFVLKYSKNEYETKISTLEEYAKLLDQHLTTLETLKGRIPEFWKDEKATEYVTVITSQIVLVRNARNRVNDLKIMYQEITGDFTGAETKIGGIIDTAKAAISRLGD